MPGAKNVQEKKELMAHVEVISLDGSDLPKIIMSNHVRQCIYVCL